jgi:hypothetical protein
MKYLTNLIIAFGITGNVSCQIMALDGMPKNHFEKYDIIFLGEYHETKGVEETEEKFIRLFKTDHTKILLEKRYDFNLLYKDFFIKRDTSEFIGYYSKPDRNFARFIYQHQLSVRAIDILRVNNLVHDPIFNIFDSKRTSQEKQQAVDSFIHSGDLNFSGGRRSMKDNSYSLLEKWDSVKPIQKIILGADSTFVEGYFEALRAALLASDDKTTNIKYASVYRENFMLSMIEQEFAKDTSVQLISINGQSHIFLGKKDKWVKSDTYEPLAKLVKERFPNKKVCSVYLLSRRLDMLFNKAYPKELEYILKNTSNGITYLIDPDFKDSPIKKLKENFTYIIVY